MSIPYNFAGRPQEELHHHFRNVCIDFRKVAKASKDPSQLDEQLDRFISTSKEITWLDAKIDGPKAVKKAIGEYQHYIKDLQSNPKQADPKNLINALADVEKLIRAHQIV